MRTIYYRTEMHFQIQRSIEPTEAKKVNLYKIQKYLKLNNQEIIDIQNNESFLKEQIIKFCQLQNIIYINNSFLFEKRINNKIKNFIFFTIDERNQSKSVFSCWIYNNDLFYKEYWMEDINEQMYGDFDNLLKKYHLLKACAI